MTDKIVEILFKHEEPFQDTGLSFVPRWKYGTIAKELLEAINYSQCCKSDSEQLPNMSLKQAIAKAKPNLDKIKDVDKHIEDIR